MKLSYDYVAGVGGIGSGILFQLLGDHTMGRNESRQAWLTDSRDYCKLHIILHYISVFLKDRLPVYAIGRVGKDENGRQLKESMSLAGINVECVAEDTCNPTMYAVCYQYPNGECCNISTKNSACREVGERDIDNFFQTISPEGKGLILAVPEVPLRTRIYLLEIGRRKNCCNVSSVLSGEVKEFVELGGIEKTDILSINEDEAGMFVKIGEGKDTVDEELLKSCIRILQKHNPDICVIITLGEKGAYAQWKDKVYRSGAMNVPVVSTAGAGDCFIGTVITAILLGIDLFSMKQEKNKMDNALDLGVLASAKKIGCKDTIDFSISRDSLFTFAQEYGVEISDCLFHFFGRTEKE